jgi:phosphate starvation-inducible PhoH-like protein
MSKTRRNFSTNGHSKNGNGYNRLEDILNNNKQNTSLTEASIRSERQAKLTPAEIASPLKRAVSGRTDNQNDYIRSMFRNDVTFCTGEAGTGKTHLATGVAARYLAEGRVDRIIFIRPTVPCDENLGFLPGSAEEKINPYLVPVYDELHEFLTAEQIKNLCGGTRPAITGVPLGMIKGRSFKRCFVIIDEAQDATYRQLKRIFTRLGEGSKLVFNGDITQSDLFRENEMTDFERFMNKMKGAESINIMEMTPADSQRHPRMAAWIERM